MPPFLGGGKGGGLGDTTGPDDGLDTGWPGISGRGLGGAGWPRIFPGGGFTPLPPLNEDERDSERPSSCLSRTEAA